MHGVSGDKLCGIMGVVAYHLTSDTRAGISADEELMQDVVDCWTENQCSLISGLPSFWQMPEGIAVMWIPPGAQRYNLS